jgi:type II secretory pathway component GspD/PulD (secretin)
VLRYLPLTILTALAVAAAAPAQDRSAADQKRGTYVVKHASAKDLAEILARRFKDADVQTGPEGVGNCLLISAPPAVFADLMKALDQLDRKPREVAVEVFVVTLPPLKGDDKPKGPDEKALAGTIDEVVAKLEAMKKKGEVADVKRLRLTAPEDQPASLTLGVASPTVAAVTTTGTGRVIRMIRYTDVGTRVRVTPQVGTDGVVMLDLSVQDSRLFTPPNAAPLGNDEKGNPIPATEPLTTTLDAKLSVASGKVVLARDAKVTSKSGEGRALILVGARVEK